MRRGTNGDLVRRKGESRIALYPRCQTARSSFSFGACRKHALHHPVLSSVNGILSIDRYCAIVSAPLDWRSEVGLVHEHPRSHDTIGPQPHDGAGWRLGRGIFYSPTSHSPCVCICVILTQWAVENDGVVSYLFALARHSASNQTGLFNRIGNFYCCRITCDVNDGE